MHPILMYHYIGDPSPHDPHRGLWVPRNEFRAQLAILNRMGRRSIDPGEYDHQLANRTGKSVWLTFDDGRIDNHREALPELKAAGHRATFFVTVEPCLRGDEGFMPLAALRELLAEGMSIGSHTLTHPRLARLDGPSLRREIVDSKHRLEDALGVAVTSFCYPYGNWNAEVIELVQQAGYQLAVSTIRGNRNTEEDRWKLKRAMVQPGRCGWRFRYLLTPPYHWLHTFKNRNKWKQDAR
jgi:peptidoglycan/xylan/chitin deacetylase (PgdA/CDA1 family)